jgi:ribonuclease J
VVLSREYAGKAPANEYRIAKLTKTQGKEELRRVRDLDLARPTDVGGLPVTPHPVDHSVPGAVGYLVEASEGVVAYTGDFRLHGPRGDRTRAFLEAARDAEPQALLIEGTHVDEGKVESEEEVLRKVTAVAAGTRGLVVAGFAPADADRMATFYRVARETDRALVLTAKQAFLLDGLVQAEEFDAFDLRDPRVHIFRKEKKSESAWEEYLFRVYANRVVEARDVRGLQEEAILVASLMDMLALPAIDPVPGSVYVLSSSEPFDEEMEISYEKLLGWLTHYGLPLFQVHASGHATAHELREAVETVGARKVFLIHTANAPLYARFLGRLGFDTVAPAEGEAYPL